MSDFIVSARKYRPDTFKSVVGQASVTETLINSILNNKLAHAYLFCGPRGVGKTTCARIFAKTINCESVQNGEACNECESCRSFNQGTSMNIHEMDAASNNSVDDIRVLIDQVRIPPQMGQYSVYIIDEVHMLSQQAFNAFLKTLEEPPKHALFIMATTEKHKILPTILSRCQTFDFNRIQLKDIAEHLAYVGQQENIQFEEQALHVIAEKADGGMRDALSIFDQIVSFSGGQLTYKSVVENLNVLDEDFFFEISESLLKADYASALNILDDIYNKGFDGGLILSGLAEFYRNVLVAKNDQTLKLLQVSEQTQNKYKATKESISVNFVYDALAILNEFEFSYKQSNNKRLHVELCFIKLSQIKAEQEKLRTVQKKAKIQKIEQPSVRIKTVLQNKGVSPKPAENKIVSSESEPATSTGNKALTEAALKERWHLVYESFKKSSFRISNILKNAKTSVADNLITLTVHSEHIAQTLEQSRAETLKVIREVFENNNINMVLKVEKGQSNHPSLTLSKDKMTHYIQKNKDFDTLITKLNLYI